MQGSTLIGFSDASKQVRQQISMGVRHLVSSVPSAACLHLSTKQLEGLALGLFRNPPVGED